MIRLPQSNRDFVRTSGPAMWLTPRPTNHDRLRRLLGLTPPATSPSSPSISPHDIAEATGLPMHTLPPATAGGDVAPDSMLGPASPSPDLAAEIASASSGPFQATSESTPAVASLKGLPRPVLQFPAYPPGETGSERIRRGSPAFWDRRIAVNACEAANASGSREGTDSADQSVAIGHGPAAPEAAQATVAAPTRIRVTLNHIDFLVQKTANAAATIARQDIQDAAKREVDRAAFSHAAAMRACGIR
jgi:hypothetical protein